jgi:hypothetical protein
MARLLGMCALLVVLAAPTALAADPTPADFKNAAKYCNSLRTSKGVEAFGTQYGTNANKKNAFGKCVAAAAKAKAKKREATEDAAEAKAAAECKKQQAQDAAKFVQDHKNFGQCVKAQKAD